jgi:hypothetical protein
MATIYRRVQTVRDSMDELQSALHDAILSDNTRDMSARAEDAQAITDRLLRDLGNAIGQAWSGQSERVQRSFVEAAISSLRIAWADAEKVGLGTSVAEMRARLLDFKTQADYAAAYLRGALGVEQQG